MPERNAHHLERYLLKDENLVIAVHRHWAVVTEPVALAVAGLGIAVWLSSTLDGRAAQLGDLAWWLWFALLGRALFYLWEWRREWFIATDRRLLLVYGFFIRQVDMMPLGKVTDMTYHRSIPGRLLGYGTFVLESAGQDQALSNLRFIAQPDSTYKSIVSQIFHREDDDSDDDPDDDYDYDDERTAPMPRLEADPTQRRGIAERLQRIVKGKPAAVDMTRTAQRSSPVQEVARKPRRGLRRHREDKPGQAGAPGRVPRGASVIAQDDADTDSLELGMLRDGGQTIYRSSNSDGTDALDYSYDSPRDDPTGMWGTR